MTAQKIVIAVPEIDDCWFKVECLEEDMPITGNASAIDDETDAQIESEIAESLNHGNPWAWCCVKVTCGFDDWQITGTDHLGGCSYKSEQDFVENSGYFQDMRLRSYEEFAAVVERMAIK